MILPLSGLNQVSQTGKEQKNKIGPSLSPFLNSLLSRSSNSSQKRELGLALEMLMLSLRTH